MQNAFRFLIRQQLVRKYTMGALSMTYIPYLFHAFVFCSLLFFNPLLFPLRIENAHLLKGNSLGKEDIITDVW